jgi:hypothetical protein
MIPVGYMAKRIAKRPDWLEASRIIDVYSVSGCVSEDFADYTECWLHNGYWFIDSPEIIKTIAEKTSAKLEDTSLFYYEMFESEFDGANWNLYTPKSSFPTKVIVPAHKKLEGFDVVSFSAGTSPECSPLSCNSMADELQTNTHCLFDSFEEAQTNIDIGSFRDCEFGPYRIFSVYSVDWSAVAAKLVLPLRP